MTWLLRLLLVLVDTMKLLIFKDNKYFDDVPAELRCHEKDFFHLINKTPFDWFPPKLFILFISFLSLQVCFFSSYFFLIPSSKVCLFVCLFSHVL